MKMPVLKKSTVSLLPQLQPNTNHFIWAHEFRTFLKAESEDLYNIITSQYKPALDLTPITIPSNEDAELGASEYWSVRSPSPKQIEEYLAIKVHQPNKEKSEESKRIRNLENLAYYYIQKAVCQEKQWMIAGETRPARCFSILCAQRFDVGSDNRLLAHHAFRGLKFEGFGVAKARSFIADWFARLQAVQEVDQDIRWSPVHFLHFLAALDRNEKCSAWVEKARFRFGDSDHASTMAQVFQDFLEYHAMLERTDESKLKHSDDSMPEHSDDSMLEHSDDSLGDSTPESFGYF